VWGYSESHLTDEFQGKEKAPEVKKQAKPSPSWAVKLAAKFEGMRGANWWFHTFIMLSAACFLGSIVYIFGVMDGMQAYIAAHPGSEKLFKTW
jgi:hypothetical protein